VAYSGPLVKIASTLNEDKRLATREDKAQFKADHQLLPLLSSGGIDRYDACTAPLRHWQHGSMLQGATS
jgi:hypothetical protein